MSRRTTALALLLAALALAAPAAASAAPGDQAVAYQLDPAHDGTTSDAITAPLTKLWSTTLPGPISYPLIANGIVYVTAQAASGDGTTLYAIQQSSGTTLWSAALGGSYSFSGLAYDAGQLFTVDYNGTLTAFDAATGATDWTTQLPGQYAFTSPPTAAGGYVYTGGAGTGGTLYAVAESNGALAWTASVENGDHSSPAVDSNGVYVTYAGNQDYAFNPTSGALLWHPASDVEGGGGTTPVLADGQLYTRDATTGNDVLSQSSGALLGNYTSATAPAVGGGVAYTADDGALVAVGDSGLGATEWTFAGDGGLDTAPLLVGGLVFEGSSSGELYAVDASSGARVWSGNVGSAIDAPDEHDADVLTGLAAAEGTLIVPAGSTLVAYAGANAVGGTPTNTLAPTIDGAPTVGQTLGADTGTWTGLPSGYAYQWLRCDASADDCAAIGGATGESYAPVLADVGSTLELSVSATNADGSSAAAISAPTAVVTAPPSEQSAPAIAGAAQVGQTLSAGAGSWQPAPTTASYQWFACYDGSCQPEVGATSSTYTVGVLDTGFHLEVRVTVADAAGSATAYSAPTAAVTPAPSSSAPAAEPLPVTLSWTQAPRISGIATVGSTLSATTGLVDALATYAYQWQSCTAGSCSDIAGAEGATYRPTAAVVSKSLRVLVTATAAGASRSDASSETAPVTQTEGVAASAAAVSRTRVELAALPNSSAFIRDGLHVSAHCAKACSVALTLRASAGDGELSGTIARASAHLRAGRTRTLTIVPARRDASAIAALRTVHLRLVVRITQGGRTTSHTDRVTIAG